MRITTALQRSSARPCVGVRRCAAETTSWLSWRMAAASLGRFGSLAHVEVLKHELAVCESAPVVSGAFFCAHSRHEPLALLDRSGTDERKMLAVVRDWPHRGPAWRAGFWLHRAKGTESVRRDGTPARGFHVGRHTLPNLGSGGRTRDDSQRADPVH